MRYLTFSMVAALSSNGGLAVGEKRQTEDRPAKSAVLGLLAAARGIPTGADQRHAELDRSLWYAVRVEDIGRRPRRLLIDFHTASTAPTRRGVVYHTRRDEVLAGGRTILSQREYLEDTSYSVALWQRAGAEALLDELREALLRPVWTLYAGRKSCPFSLPLNPILVEAIDVRGAFVKRDEATAEEREFRRSLGLEAAPRYVAVDSASSETGARIETRRDTIVSRVRWQHSPREEAVSPWALP